MANLQPPTLFHEIPTSKPTFSDTISPENYIWWRKVSAFKTTPSNTVKIKKTPLHKTQLIPTNNRGTLREEREKIKEKLATFRAKCRELSRVSYNGRGGHRIDLMAMEELKKQGIISKKANEVTGSIPGVEIGDTFKYRVELVIVGLHRRNQHGIDFIIRERDVIATCVVSTEGYPDKMSDNNVLMYIGEGGIYGCKEGDSCKDQKMERGNLALKNSCKVGNDVRVVKGVKYGYRYCDSRPVITYVYDGLYKVVDCKKKRDFKNNLMFEFKLRRNPNQPYVPWHKFKSMV